MLQLDMTRLRDMVLRAFRLLRSGEKETLPGQLRSLHSQLKAHHGHCREAHLNTPKVQTATRDSRLGGLTCTPLIDDSKEGQLAM